MRIFTWLRCFISIKKLKWKKKLWSAWALQTGHIEKSALPITKPSTPIGIFFRLHFSLCHIRPCLIPKPMKKLKSWKFRIENSKVCKWISEAFYWRRSFSWNGCRFIRTSSAKYRFFIFRVNAQKKMWNNFVKRKKNMCQFAKAKQSKAKTVWSRLKLNLECALKFASFVCAIFFPRI